MYKHIYIHNTREGISIHGEVRLQRNQRKLMLAYIISGKQCTSVKEIHLFTFKLKKVRFKLRNVTFKLKGHIECDFFKFNVTSFKMNVFFLFECDIFKFELHFF